MKYSKDKAILIKALKDLKLKIGEIEAISRAQGETKVNKLMFKLWQKIHKSNIIL